MQSEFDKGFNEGIKKASELAAMFSMRPGARVHPDVPWAEMNESAKTAAHSTAQQIALEIQDLEKKVPQVGDRIKVVAIPPGDADNAKLLGQYGEVVTADGSYLRVKMEESGNIAYLAPGEVEVDNG